MCTTWLQVPKRTLDPLEFGGTGHHVGLGTQPQQVLFTTEPSL